MTLSAGTKLGPYEIVSPLGAGGMGEVYSARDTRLGREVAVKVLPPSFSQDANRLRRFEQEARAVSALNHPNVVSLYDVGQHDGAPYVVIELLEGETLRERFASGALSPRKAIDYAIQIAQGPSRRSRQRNHPSRPQAREHLRHSGRTTEDPGLRIGQTHASR